MIRPTLLSALAVAVLAVTATGESTDIDSVTLGALTERADLVVVAEAGTDATTFRVIDTLRGAAAVADIRLVFRTTPASGPSQVIVRPGAAHVCFLHSLGGNDYEPLALPWGLRDASDAAVRPLIDYTRRYAAALSPDGKIERPADLAALLVESMSSPAGGVPSSAGRDLIRHDEIVASLTPAQRQAIDAAVAVPRKPDLDLASIIDAAGVAGTAASNESLIVRLVDPATRHLRFNVTAALARHASDAVVAALASRLPGTTPQQRADVIHALGRLDLRSAEPHLVKALGDELPSVRVESAHSLGLLARAVRTPKPDAAPDAPREKLGSTLDPLVKAIPGAATSHEKRALCWALAQIDTDEAWTTLRRLSAESADERIRELAKQYLLAPRVALLLE